MSAWLNAKHVHEALVGHALPRVLLRLGVEHGVLLGRARDEDGGSIEDLRADLQADVRITDDVLVPQAVAGGLAARTRDGPWGCRNVGAGPPRACRGGQPQPPPRLPARRRGLFR